MTRSPWTAGEPSTATPDVYARKVFRQSSRPVALSSASSQGSLRPPRRFAKCQAVAYTVSPWTRTPFEPERNPVVSPVPQVQRRAPVWMSSAETEAPHAGTNTVRSSASIRLSPR